jgi:putative oxidoreductase
MSKLDRILLLAGRWLIAAIFLWSGTHKLLSPAAPLVANIARHGLPFPELARWASISVELGGGVLLVLGLAARPAAAALALFCIVTALAFHNSGDQFIDLMKNVAMAGGLLQIVGFGAGPWSLDARASGTMAESPRDGLRGLRTLRE